MGTDSCALVSVEDINNRLRPLVVALILRDHVLVKDIDSCALVSVEDMNNRLRPLVVAFDIMRSCPS